MTLVLKKNKSLLNRRENWIVLIYSIMPLMDTLNGIFKQNEINFSVGFLYRFISLFFLFLIVRNKIERILFSRLLILLGGMLSLGLIHIVTGVSLNKELYMLSTWLLFPLFLFLLYLAYKNETVRNESIEKILDFYLWIVPSTILIPRFFNLGATTYSGGQGYKAYYYATNGISYFLGILIIYAMFKLMIKFCIKMFIQMSLVAASCILVGTISSIGSLIISIVISAILISWRYPSKRKYLVISIIVVGIAIICITMHYYNELRSVYLRKIYFLNSGEFDNFVDFITSGRTILLRNIWNGIEQNNKIMVLALGQGFKTARECELDYSDFVLQYGFAGIIFATIFLYRVKEKFKNHCDIVKILIMYTLAYAGIVGHVFTNAMSSMLFALILCTDSDYMNDVGAKTLSSCKLYLH